MIAMESGRSVEAGRRHFLLDWACFAATGRIRRAAMRRSAVEQSSSEFDLMDALSGRAPLIAVMEAANFRDRDDLPV